MIVEGKKIILLMQLIVLTIIAGVQTLKAN